MADSLFGDRSGVVSDNGMDLEDPFVSHTPVETHAQRDSHRYSTFDAHLFSLNTASPSHAKRALKAHLAETERRLHETSKLGTALVEQQRELTDKLTEVENQQADGEIGQDLRQKLCELEKEYNEIGRQTARVALGPKLRALGQEDGLTTPSLERVRSSCIAYSSTVAVIDPLCSITRVLLSFPARRPIRPPKSPFPPESSVTSRQAVSTTSNLQPKSAPPCSPRSVNSKPYWQSGKKPSKP